MSDDHLEKIQAMPPEEVKVCWDYYSEKTGFLRIIQWLQGRYRFIEPLSGRYAIESARYRLLTYAPLDSWLLEKALSEKRDHVSSALFKRVHSIPRDLLNDFDELVVKHAQYEMAAVYYNPYNLNPIRLEKTIKSVLESVDLNSPTLENKFDILPPLKGGDS